MFFMFVSYETYTLVRKFFGYYDKYMYFCSSFLRG